MIGLSCITKELGHDLIEALPAYHGFTGSDFKAAFARQGKVKPFETVLKDSKFQTSESLSLNNADIIELEKCVCTMCGRLDPPLCFIGLLIKKERKKIKKT